jgi:thiopurine S-methyltransferase
MEAGYWLQRWREGRTGWHRDQVMPLLQQHWPTLEVPRGSPVLVPLCGKSVDILWLARQGMHVLGVEISPIAVELFLAEHQLHARTRTHHYGTHYEVTNPPDGSHIDIINGDIFDADPGMFANCDAFYDRAATIALPPEVRTRLVSEVYAKLSPDARGLLITLDYPQAEAEGPPFSVDATEVNRLFDTGWEVRELERRDILASQPMFSERGVTALHTGVYALARRHA